MKNVMAPIPQRKVQVDDALPWAENGCGGSLVVDREQGAVVAAVSVDEAGHPRI